MRTLQANNERREPTKKRDQQPLKQIMNELRAIVRFSTLKCSWSPPPSPRFYRYSSADEVINQGIQCSCILANWDRNSENHFLWIHNFTCGRLRAASKGPPDWRQAGCPFLKWGVQNMFSGVQKFENFWNVFFSKLEKIFIKKWEFFDESKIFYLLEVLGNPFPWFIHD